MLRDSLVGLIEPMFSSAGTYPLALSTEWKRSSDDRPPCLENPRPEGAESTLTENALSPFHAEPKQTSLNVVSGLSAMGTTDTKVTATTKGSTHAHLLRFVTDGTPKWKERTARQHTCQALLDC